MNRRLIGVLLGLPLLGGCAALQSLDRGLYSVAEQVSERDRVTGQRMLSLEGRAAQIQKGNQAVEAFLAEQRKAGKRLNADYDGKAYARIVAIFDRLQRVSHLRDERWTPVLVESEEWNAFTTGGTYFVVFSGLVEAMPDDAELANVIAHEMAHTVANHAFERSSYQTVNALGGSRSAQRRSFQAAFTHENEREADRLGILYCALAGFDPYAGARIWERMHRQRGSAGFLVQDHPMNAERAQEARETAKLVARYYRQGVENRDSQAILKNNELFAVQRSAVEVGAGGGALALLETAFTTYEQKLTAKAEEARQAERVAQVRAVQQASRLVSSRPVAANRWQVVLEYRGSRALADVTFRAQVKQSQQQPLVMLRDWPAVIEPNSRVTLEFESDQLDAYGMTKESLVVGYDKVRLL